MWHYTVYSEYYHCYYSCQCDITLYTLSITTVTVVVSVTLHCILRVLPLLMLLSMWHYTVYSEYYHCYYSCQCDITLYTLSITTVTVVVNVTLHCILRVLPLLLSVWHYIVYSEYYHCSCSVTLHSSHNNIHQVLWYTVQKNSDENTINHFKILLNLCFSLHTWVCIFMMH